VLGAAKAFKPCVQPLQRHRPGARHCSPELVSLLVNEDAKVYEKGKARGHASNEEQPTKVAEAEPGRVDAAALALTGSWVTEPFPLSAPSPAALRVS